MGKNKQQKYAPKGGGGYVAGPTLCIDTIADPEILQRHIEVSCFDWFMWECMLRKICME